MVCADDTVIASEVPVVTVIPVPVVQALLVQVTAVPSTDVHNSSAFVDVTVIAVPLLTAPAAVENVGLAAAGFNV